MPDFSDLLHAARTLRRSPGFTLVAVACLALGIGANSAIFALVDAALLRPLPYPVPDRLVTLREVSRKGAEMPVSDPNFQDWKARTRSFDGMAEWGLGPTTVLGADRATRATLAPVSRGFFDVMGRRPAIGRTFTADEHVAGASPAAVVSDHFWREHLGAARDVIGRPLEADGRTFTIVGVMPPSFTFPDRADLWIPVELYGSLGARTAHNFQVIARLRPGVTLDQARREMNALTARIAGEQGSNDDAAAASVVGLQDRLVGSARGHLAILMGAVLCVLLIVCLNLAGTLLARDRARAREMAVRTALGAGRARLVRQLLGESLLLAIVGGAAGLWLARIAAHALAALMPAELAGAAPPALDLRVALFTSGIALAAGITVGLFPALRSSRVDLRAVLAEGGRGATRRGGRLRAGLVAGEIALAVVLLTSAGLLLRSLARLLGVDPGFDARGVATITVSPPGSRYTTPDAAMRYYQRVLDRVAALPGVAQAGSATAAPLAPGDHSNGAFAVEGGTSAQGYGEYRVVDGDFFRALRIPLLQGRDFGPDDRPGGMDAVIVSRSLADRSWPGADPLGRRIRFLGMDDQPDRWLTVVGVVGDVRDRALATAGDPTAYLYAPQRPYRTTDGMTFVVRTNGDVDALLPRLRDAVRDVDPNVPAQLATMEHWVRASSADRRFLATLLGAFAGAATLLAAIGIYAVLSYMVVERRREIGVRMALGARRADVLRDVVARGLVLAAAGLAGGVALALALARVMASQLYGVTSTDAATYAGVCALLALVALAASWLPAWRAMRVDPMIALRGD